MKYKPPKYILFYVYIFFLIYIFLFVRPQQSERVQLGIFELEKYNETKVNLNIYNIRELEIEIIDTYTTPDDKLCNLEEIYIFGSLPSFNRFVRLRIQDVEVSSGLKVTNEVESENYSRVDYQDPIKVVSNSFNCVDETIFIEFEENINIDYLRIIQDDSDTYRSVKLINIDAYS